MPPDEGRTRTSVGGSEAESTEEALSDAAATAGTDEISRSTEDSVATNKVTQAGVMPSWAPAIYGMAVVAPRAEMIRTKYGSSSSGFVHQGQKVTAMPDGDTSVTEATDSATPVNERHAEIEAVEYNAAVGSYDPFEEQHTVAAAMCNRFTQPIAHWSKTVHAKWFKILTKAEAVNYLTSRDATPRSASATKVMTNR